MPGPPLNFLIHTDETACYSTCRLLLCVARTVNVKIDTARQIEAPLNRRVDERFNPYEHRSPRLIWAAAVNSITRVHALFRRIRWALKEQLIPIRISHLRHPHTVADEGPLWLNVAGKELVVKSQRIFAREAYRHS
jgi:hypothetical protein